MRHKKSQQHKTCFLWNPMKQKVKGALHGLIVNVLRCTLWWWTWSDCLYWEQSSCSHPLCPDAVLKQICAEPAVSLLPAEQSQRTKVCTTAADNTCVWSLVMGCFPAHIREKHFSITQWILFQHMVSQQLHSNACFKVYLSDITSGATLYWLHLLNK